METQREVYLSSKRYDAAARHFHGVFKKETELSLCSLDTP